MPVVVCIAAVVVVDPVLARQDTQAGCSCEAKPKHEVDVGVTGEVARVELRYSIGVVLQFLVLVGVQPADAKLELMASLCP